MTPVWLASGSPRRRELLTWAGLAVEVAPTHCDESRRPGVPPVAHAREVAERKAAASKAPAGRVVLSADTVVHIDDELFEKPRDPAHAVEMLTRLSGRGHAVTTAVCVGRDGAWETLHCTTEVRFRALTLAEIAAYVATGDAADKAGAYGIQGRAGSFVTDVRGDYTNVIGLPLEAALGLLERYGLSTRTR